MLDKFLDLPIPANKVPDAVTVLFEFSSAMV
jgi:hypothetical protein